MGNQEINVEKYYKLYGPLVLRRCRHLLGDEEKALDAMQEVFVKLVLNQKRFKDDYPSSLLYRITTNFCLNIIRDQRLSCSIGGEDILAKIADLDEKENNAIVNSLLEYVFRREKRSTREIAVMFYIDEMTLREVALESGLSVSGVRKRLRQLKERLKRDKEEIYYGK
jgi:RNA polymerase sigma-70 factor (ECF subfamily)